MLNTNATDNKKISAVALDLADPGVDFSTTFDARRAVDVIQQLRSNMEKLDDLQGRLSFLLKEVSTLVEYKSR